jgi:WD40 repeat protein
MRRLKQEGFACTFIDLSIGGTQQTSEQWYAGMLRNLTNDLELEVNLRSWWREREWLSPLERFREFIESVMLVQKTENIVIFIDEIDSVLSLGFPTDDFFAFIRACYNQRVDNSEYNRLTFCLLGVATPSDLIQDKKRTPFNIGRAIELIGFTLDEAKSRLTQGLAEKADKPEKVLKEVLDWTDGQPFLTQKLCKLVVDKAESRKPNIEQLVQKYIIENWESQDEPEHLKTIRARLLSNEQYTSRLLGMYQQILQWGEMLADGSSEQMQLQLSGLVVKQNGKLRVYNRIYESVFDHKFVEKALANLRPYGEVIAAWLASNCQDESRLLRGKALRDALAWKDGKSLSDWDYQFLDASRELEKRDIQIALTTEKEATLILAEANQTLTEAQQKAKQTIRRGFAGLVLLSVVAITVVVGISKTLRDAQSKLKEAQEVTRLEQTVAALPREDMIPSPSYKKEALLSALRAGQDLQALVKGARLVRNYPTTSPILALQAILDNADLSTPLDSKDVGMSVSFSPDGQRIATINGDTVRLWNLSGRQLAELKGQGKINDVSFSPDGQQLVTSSIDGTVRFWNLKGKPLATWNTKVNFFHETPDYLDFTSDGQRLITEESFRSKIRLWNLSGKQLATWQVDSDQFGSLNFSPDEQHLASVGIDNKIRLWNLSGKQLAQWELPLDGGLGKDDWSVWFSRDGQRLATVGSDKIILWNLSGKKLAQWQVPGFRDMNFSPDGQHIAIFTHDKSSDTVQLWNLSGKRLAEIKSQRGSFNSMDFSPNGQRLALQGKDGAVSIWNWSRKQLVKIIKGQREAITSLKAENSIKGIKLKESSSVEKLSFSPDGKHLAGIEEGGIAKLWNLSGQQVAELRGHQNIGVTFSPDARHLATEGKDGTVRLWNLSGQQVAKLKSNQGKIDQVSFSPDGQHLATVVKTYQALGESMVLTLTGVEETVQDWKALNSVVELWSLSGKQLAQLKGHQGDVLSVKLSPDGQHLATRAEDGTAKLWDMSGRQLAELKGQGKINDVSFSPDGQMIATAGENGTLRLWDVSGKQLAEWRVAEGKVNHVSFSPDGQRLITDGVTDTLRIWDLSGRKLTELRANSNSFGFAEVSFTPDGQRIAILSGSTAQIWNLSGGQIAQYNNPLGFSPDGKYVATKANLSVNRDHPVLLKRVEGLDELLAEGCDRLTDYFVSHPEALKELHVCKKN